jgi:hypothetical protein
MNATHCPLCYEPLEVREVSPCMDCGSKLEKLGHARVGEYTYAEYRIFRDLSLVLCSFCQWDFSSYDPTFFGLPRGTWVGMESRRWTFVREVQPVITKDKCCAHCGYRLPFLEFVARARELHSDDEEMA